MKRLSSVAEVSLVVLLVASAALSGVRVAEAVTCNLTELSPCIRAITTSDPPSTACCSKLREQIPCLCGYLRDPKLKQYANSPTFTKILSTCRLPYPPC